MICEDCKFADWIRTESGRLHPCGQGKCTWETTLCVAGSARGMGIGSVVKENKIEVSGGYICRKNGEEYPKACPVFQRKDKT